MPYFLFIAPTLRIWSPCSCVIIIADISENSQKNIDGIKKIQNQLRKTKIIVTSYSTASSLIVKAFQAGARDFLIKPLIDKDFIKVAQKMVSLIKGNINDRAKCKVVTVFSNKGGVGKTSLAINLAYEIYKETNSKICVLDLSFNNEDVSVFLDIEQKHDIDYILSNIENFVNRLKSGKVPLDHSLQSILNKLRSILCAHLPQLSLYPNNTNGEVRFV